MGTTTKEFWGKFISLLPLLILFFISLNGSSVINVKFFSINIHYILVYYWVLRQPQSLGYGFIFLSGLISDVVLGFPLGINSSFPQNCQATIPLDKCSKLSGMLENLGSWILEAYFLLFLRQFY